MRYYRLRYSRQWRLRRILACGAAWSALKDDARTGEVVIADDDPRVVLEKAKGRNHVVVRGRVPRADEPIYVGLG